MKQSIYNVPFKGSTLQRPSFNLIVPLNEACHDGYQLGQFTLAPAQPFESMCLLKRAFGKYIVSSHQDYLTLDSIQERRGGGSLTKALSKWGISLYEVTQRCTSLMSEHREGMFLGMLYAQIPTVLFIINCPHLSVSGTTFGVTQ